MRRIDLRKANVARAGTIRNINRQIILNYIRERGPISRAEISSETALQRSTVSLIVDELKQQGLIDEIEGESTGGRPPILLGLRAAGAIALGVDMGTIRTVVATSDLAGRVLEQKVIATDPNPDKMLKLIVEHAKCFLQREKEIEGIGISVPGLVDAATGKVHFIPHFKWRDWNVVAEVQKRTGLPVFVENDANAAALAELWFGRPEIRDVRDFIMVLVEGGLGTGIVFDGQVYQGKAGVAGEFGHMTIGTNAPVACASGSRECWEAFASERAALSRYSRRSIEQGVNTAAAFEDLVDRALDSEDAARRALIETARFLGVGISNLIKGLSPEAVIVGGRIARAWPIVGEALTNAVEENSICRGFSVTQIFASSLGANPTLMGALSLILAGKFSYSYPA